MPNLEYNEVGTHFQTRNTFHFSLLLSKVRKTCFFLGGPWNVSTVPFVLSFCSKDYTTAAFLSLVGDLIWGVKRLEFHLR